MTRASSIQATKDLIIQESNTLRIWHRSHRARDLIVVHTLANIEDLRYCCGYVHYLYQRLCKRVGRRLLFRHRDVIRRWELERRELDLIAVYTLLCCEREGGSWVYGDEQVKHLRSRITEYYLPDSWDRQLDDWDKLRARDFQKVMTRLVEADVSEDLDCYCTWKASCEAFRQVHGEYKAGEASGCIPAREDLSVGLKQKYDELVREAPYKACMDLEDCALWQWSLGIYEEFAGRVFTLNSDERKRSG